MTSKQTGISRNADCLPTVRVPPDKNAHIGRMRVKSMIFAPIMLPMESSDCFLATAVRVVTSSGKDVPIAIMVTPIIASDTPKWRAITVPSSTSKSAPTTTAAAPIKNLTILSAICFPVCSVFSTSPESAERDFLPEMIFSIIKTANIAIIIMLCQRFKSRS